MSTGWVTFADEMKLWDADPQDWIKEACRRLRYLPASLLRQHPGVADFCKDILPIPGSLLEAVSAGNVIYMTGSARVSASLLMSVPRMLICQSARSGSNWLRRIAME